MIKRLKAMKEAIRCMVCAAVREGFSREFNRMYDNPMCYHCGAQDFKTEKEYRAKAAILGNISVMSPIKIHTQLYR